MELYEPKELAKIVTRSAGILGIDIEADGALEIASRSRGTPRIANRMLKRVRDFAQIMSDGVITYSTAKIALDRLEIDELGLDSGDRRMLNAIIQYYNGGPVGVETLAAAIGEEAVTIEDVVEPYLMQIGFCSVPRAAAVPHARLTCTSDLRRREPLRTITRDSTYDALLETHAIGMRGNRLKRIKKSPLKIFDIKRSIRLWEDYSVQTVFAVSRTMTLPASLQ